MSDFLLRPMTKEDNPKIAEIIRTVMPEFGASGKGFAINDPEVDTMYEAYKAPRHFYYVVESRGKVVGGGGIGTLIGADSAVCELRKMYFLKDARGLGAGKALLQKCLDGARAHGYHLCYLETLKGMQRARTLYELFGFKQIDHPMGNTGHHGCDIWYALDLRSE